MDFVRREKGRGKVGGKKLHQVLLVQTKLALVPVVEKQRRKNLEALLSSKNKAKKGSPSPVSQSVAVKCSTCLGKSIHWQI